MAILTESRIKSLLRTTKLKETKFLVLEPGTVITPSAKEYLKDITIEYMDISANSETKNQEKTSPKNQLKINESKNKKSELCGYLQELEYFIAKEMKENLTIEDYINCISIASSLKDYCCIMLVQSKKNSVK